MLCFDFLTEYENEITSQPWTFVNIIMDASHFCAQSDDFDSNLLLYHKYHHWNIIHLICFLDLLWYNLIVPAFPSPQNGNFTVHMIYCITLMFVNL